MTSQSEGYSSAAGRLPDGLARDRHVEVEERSPWPRRVVVVFLAAFCIAALANVFGQVATVDTADTARATLTVDSPVRLRAGLMFTSVVTVATHQPLQDARLQFSPGWFNGMTLNALAPQSQQEASDQNGATFDYGQVGADASLPVWISWQVNPTTLGPRSTDVVLYDGSTPVASVRRTVTVFP